MIKIYFASAGVGLLLLITGLIVNSSLPLMIGFLLLSFFGLPMLSLKRDVLLSQSFRLDVNSAGMIVDSGKNREAFPFSDVESLSFGRMPSVFLEIRFVMKDGRELRLPTHLERPDYILDAFALARPELASAIDFQHFRREFVSRDHGAARLGQLLLQPHRFLLVTFGKISFSVVSFLAAVWMASAMGLLDPKSAFENSGLSFLELAVAMPLIWLVRYALVETYHQRSGIRILKEDPYALRRDREHEADVYRLTTKWTYVASVAIALLVVFVMSKTESAKDIASSVSETRAPASVKQNGEH